MFLILDALEVYDCQRAVFVGKESKLLKQGLWNLPPGEHRSQTWGKIKKYISLFLDQD